MYLLKKTVYSLRSTVLHPHQNSIQGFRTQSIYWRLHKQDSISLWRALKRELGCLPISPHSFLIMFNPQVFWILFEALLSSMGHLTQNTIFFSAGALQTPLNLLWGDKNFFYQIFPSGQVLETCKLTNHWWITRAKFYSHIRRKTSHRKWLPVLL